MSGEGKGTIELRAYHKLERAEGRETIETWADKLDGWLPRNVEQAKIQEYANALIENEINTVPLLAQLEASDLADLKFPTGHRAIILEAARKEARQRTPVSYFSVCGHLGLKLHGMWEEVSHAPLWQGVVGEFLASAVFVFILNSIIVSSGILVQNAANTPGTDDSLSVKNLTPDRYLSISIGAGFAFALSVFTFHPVGAGHVTPAISFALAFSSAISPLRWALYLAAQLLGAMIATGFVNTLSYSKFDQAQGGRNIIQPGYTPGSSVGIETLTTFILVLTALAFHDKGKAKGTRGFGPAALGFVVLVVHLIALPINGASMNPARSFASSAVFHDWDAQWTYWLGPYLGSAIAVLFYEFLLRDKDPNGKKECSQKREYHGEKHWGGDDHHGHHGHHKRSRSHGSHH